GGPRQAARRWQWEEAKLSCERTARRLGSLRGSRAQESAERWPPSTRPVSARWNGGFQASEVRETQVRAMARSWRLLRLRQASLGWRPRGASAAGAPHRVRVPTGGGVSRTA